MRAIMSGADVQKFFAECKKSNAKNWNQFNVQDIEEAIIFNDLIISIEKKIEIKTL